jgi:hypothetical protein
MREIDNAMLWDLPYQHYSLERFCLNMVSCFLESVEILHPEADWVFLAIVEYKHLYHLWV